ncbi:hypothetical protein ACOME3_008893 [Neoechinorhynchus agilis]
MTSGIRPENIVNRAEELMRVNKPHLAIQTLLDCIDNRKHRNNFDGIKPVIALYLSICIKMRDSAKAKAGIVQYRNICQNGGADRLEAVMINFLENSEKRTDEALKSLHKYKELRQLDDGSMDDLENIQSPEMLQKVANGEMGDDYIVEINETMGASGGSGDPLANYGAWLRFLWEAYRMCLETLKNNTRVEVQYKTMVLLCYKFAVRHERRSEFRKLCDSVRQHLNTATRNLAIPGTAVYGIRLENSDTVKAYIHTRIVQFNCAVELNMWQEAYRAIEDLHTLLVKAGTRSCTAFQFITYYWKAATAFWNAGLYAHHAQALFHQFTIYRKRKYPVTKEEMARMSTRLVLAILAVPTYKAAPTQSDNQLELDDGQSERQKQLYSLLNLTRPPTRESLLADLKIINISEYTKGTKVGEILARLLRSLDADSLNLLETFVDESVKEPAIQSCEDSPWSLDAGIPEYIVRQYVPHIRSVVVSIYLQQTSQLYSTVSISRLQKLCPCNTPTHRVLNYSLQMCRSKVFDATVDDVNETVTFRRGFRSVVTSADANSIQMSEQEALRSHLKRITFGSAKVIDNIIAKNKFKNPIEQRNAAKRSQLVQAQLSATKKHELAKERFATIESFKKMKEVRLIKIRQTEMQMERQRHEREAEMEEARKRDRSQHRKKIEQEELERQERQRTKDLMMTFDMGRKFLAGKTDEELVNIDIREIELAQEINDRKVEKERREKLARQAKKIDYYYRACHQVQLEGLKKMAQEKCNEMRDHWDKSYNLLEETVMDEYQKSLEHRDRLRLKEPEINQYVQTVMEKRENALKDKVLEHEKRYEELREKVALRRKEQRKIQRKAEYEAELKRKAEEEKRLADEKKYRAPTTTPVVPPTKSSMPVTRGRFQNLESQSSTYPRRWNNPPQRRNRSPPQQRQQQQQQQQQQPPPQPAYRAPTAMGRTASNYPSFNTNNRNPTSPAAAPNTTPFSVPRREGVRRWSPPRSSAPRTRWNYANTSKASETNWRNR